MRLANFDLIDWVTDAQLDLDDEQLETWVRKGFKLTHPHIWNSLRTEVSWHGGRRFVKVHVEQSRLREAISVLNDIEHIYCKFHSLTAFVLQ